MLDYVLVMGHVPGTNIDLSFNQIVIGCLLVVMLYIAYRLRPSVLRVGYKTIQSGLMNSLNFTVAKLLRTRDDPTSISI